MIQLLAPIVTTCRNPGCRRRCRPHRRGLCWQCYLNPLVRSTFPSESAHGKRLRGDGCEELDFDGPAPLPKTPTAAGPGTLEKIEVLGERAGNGVQLDHPHDAKESTNGLPPKWRITLPSVNGDAGQTLEEFAPTKSEARGLAKKRLGLKSRGLSLPSGTIVERIL
jgi:hypothetical protein